MRTPREWRFRRWLTRDPVAFDSVDDALVAP